MMLIVCPPDRLPARSPPVLPYRCSCRIILRGKELEDGNLLSECGLDDEAPTVHLVMRLPAPGTARRKRDPTFAGKEGQCGGGGAAKTPAGGFKIKTEPTDEDDLAAMSFAGIRHLSDMLVDGDQMEFEQVRSLCCCCSLCFPHPAGAAPFSSAQKSYFLRQVGLAAWKVGGERERLREIANC